MRQVYVHIGAPKTGTTYLQDVLDQNRAALAERGVFYPEGALGAHHRAAWDLRRPTQRARVAALDGEWKSLMNQVNAWPGRMVVISSEHLVFAKEEHVAKVMAQIDGEVHVVYTARDLVRQVPAVWQERVKNQYLESLDEFLTAVTGEPGARGYRAFWRAQDIMNALRRWGSSLDPRHVHVVTTPPAGSANEVLLERFLAVLGLVLDDVEPDVSLQPNTSLNRTQAELLRHYNQRYGKKLTWPRYRDVIGVELRHSFALAAPEAEQVRLSPRQQRFFVVRAEAMVADVAAAGFDVSGDLRDLVPNTRKGSLLSRTGGVPEVTEHELLEAAIDVIDIFCQREFERRRANGELH
ncbi:MAG: hypothetical protein ACRDPG_02905 [Nocardioidaceae bacterium]